jgi:hypothetical protein
MKNESPRQKAPKIKINNRAYDEKCVMVLPKSSKTWMLKFLKINGMKWNERVKKGKYSFNMPIRSSTLLALMQSTIGL